MISKQAKLKSDKWECFDIAYYINCDNDTDAEIKILVGKILMKLAENKIPETIRFESLVAERNKNCNVRDGLQIYFILRGGKKLAFVIFNKE